MKFCPAEGAPACFLDSRRVEIKGDGGAVSWWCGGWAEHSSQLVKNFFATLDDQPARQSGSQATRQPVISNAFLATEAPKEARRVLLLFTQGGVLVLVHVLAFCIDCRGPGSVSGPGPGPGNGNKKGSSGGNRNHGHGRDSYRMGKYKKKSRGWAENLMQILCLHFPLYI